MYKAFILFLCLLLPCLFEEVLGKNSVKEFSTKQNSVWEDVKSLPGWIWQTEKNLFTKTAGNSWLLTGLATGAAYLYDDRIDHYLKKHKPFQKGAEAFDIGGRYAYSLTWAGFYLTGKISGNKKLVQTGRTILITNLSANIVGTILWFGVGRRRPDIAKNRHDFDPFNFKNLKATVPPFDIQPSFPSLHTVGLASIATVVTKHYGWSAGIPLFGLTAMVGYSRMAREGHYLSDIVAGGSLGILTGLVVCELMDSGNTKSNTQVSINPVFGIKEGKILTSILVEF